MPHFNYFVGGLIRLAGSIGVMVSHLTTAMYRQVRNYTHARMHTHTHTLYTYNIVLSVTISIRKISEAAMNRYMLS